MNSPCFICSQDTIPSLFERWLLLYLGWLRGLPDNSSGSAWLWSMCFRHLSNLTSRIIVDSRHLLICFVGRLAGASNYIRIGIVCLLHHGGSKRKAWSLPSLWIFVSNINLYKTGLLPIVCIIFWLFNNGVKINSPSIIHGLKWVPLLKLVFITKTSLNGLPGINHH